MNTRQLFQQHLGQTSKAPIGLHITKAEGNYLYDENGKAYLDLIGGISVCHLGHQRPEILAAIHHQVDSYLHVMVYGEVIQSPQVAYASALAEHLPKNLQSVFFTNSGSEATEGAIKLAKRVTGKTDIIACNNSYHGSTNGALSLMGSEYWRNAFRPLLPGIWHYDYNSYELINAINLQTAAVLIETFQAEAGIIIPKKEWLKDLKEKCNKTGTLLILDEIQCGFGRTGKLWGFEHFDIKPDILLLGKALGGGMPLGAFISSTSMMNSLTENPVLGHISTFGGHPVSCAAGLAGFQTLLKENFIEDVSTKADLFIQLLKHPKIKAVRHIGLLMAIELEDNQTVLNLLKICLDKGVFSDWFLFASNCVRIAPPLTISHDEIIKGCNIILSSLNEN